MLSCFKAYFLFPVMHSKSWVYCNFEKQNLWVGTVSMNIKGLVGHKGGYIILTLRGRGIEFTVLKIFKEGGEFLISYGIWFKLPT